MDATKHIVFRGADTEEPLKDMYEELGERFEERLLKVATNFVRQEEDTEPDYFIMLPESLNIQFQDDSLLTQDYITLNSYALVVSMKEEELDEWTEAYKKDRTFSKVLKAATNDEEDDEAYPQYLLLSNLLIKYSIMF